MYLLFWSSNGKHKWKRKRKQASGMDILHFFCYYILFIFIYLCNYICIYIARERETGFLRSFDGQYKLYLGLVSICKTLVDYLGCLVPPEITETPVMHWNRVPSLKCPGGTLSILECDGLSWSAPECYGVLLKSRLLLTESN